ncbi:MAG TPA: GIY-YIG nuclease family protein [Terriglobales bacterium]|nr:GIY-YIG nuclease family protein [Terriglobales bacterium]
MRRRFEDYRFFVYMLGSSSRRAIYVGFTSEFRKRIWQHKNHELEGFTDRYNVIRLLWYERYQYAANAIAREKQIKRWSRKKKIWLIEQMNPGWKDLAADWFPEAQAPSTRLGPAQRDRALARDDNA